MEDMLSIVHTISVGDNGQLATLYAMFAEHQVFKLKVSHSVRSTPANMS